MPASPKALLAAAFLALALVVGLAFHFLAPDDGGPPPLDAAARSSALRAEAARDRAVDRILAAAPVIGDALGSRAARVTNRSAWFQDGQGAPIGEVVLVTFLAPVDLPGSYRTPVEPGDGSGTSGAGGTGGRVATEPLAAADGAGVEQLVVLVDVDRGRVHAVSPVSSLPGRTGAGG